MKTVAYIRVSKNDQDVNHQKLAILEFAQRQRISIDQFISVTSSSRKSKKERKIDQLLGLLEKGDSLIVSELSRIGRSVGEIITVLPYSPHQPRETDEKCRLCLHFLQRTVW